MNIYVEDKHIKLLLRNGISPCEFAREAFLEKLQEENIEDVEYEERGSPVDPEVCPQCGRGTEWYGDAYEEATICSHCRIQWPADRI